MCKKFFRLMVYSLLLFSCSDNQDLITNRDREADIQRMLSVQKELTAHSEIDIWGIFRQGLSLEEKQAMEFLYAYMPLSDLADYNPEFFLKNVRYSLKAREEMPWGKSIPEQEFLHFVLPLRVNNENLDNFREVMYGEITQRVKDLDIKQAALEINHWCHEKVNYRGTDSRTGSPLATVSKTFGRCGEESTFTVTALRTAGIPARQVYTPRWAHTDDNHAWVEVWIDGKWHYLGACEPEVDLDLGWFTEPSRRVMLVHTRTYGRYFGEEEVIARGDRFSELNLTSNYAPVKRITVAVKDIDGHPVDSARVEFQLYNYAEYYPLAVAYAQGGGYAGFTTGLGDLVVWAAKEGVFGWKKLSVPESDTLELVLNQTSGGELSESVDLVPPHATKVEMIVTEEAGKANDVRLAYEDSVRNVTFSTFKDSSWAVGLAEKTGLSSDSLVHLIRLSYGNWQQMAAYVEKNGVSHRKTLLELAFQLAPKDLSDTPEPILTDHLEQVARWKSDTLVPDRDLFIRYLLSPRVALENLSPWRSFLADAFGTEMARQSRDNITVLTDWMRQNIVIDTEANRHSRAPLTPIGVYNLRVADPVSRDIFFVAACRTFGLPARLHPETRMPEYFKDGSWLRAGFDPDPLNQPDKGMLKLVSLHNQVVPQYYLHYTVGCLKEGFYETLEFPEGADLTSALEPVSLDAGSYRLVTGNRLENGSVLSQMTFFTVEKGKVSVVPVELRKSPGKPEPLGKLDLTELTLTSAEAESKRNITTISKGKSVVLILFDPGSEPSKHILNDLGPYVDHFNQWDGTFIFAVSDAKNLQTEVLNSYPLPGSRVLGTDKDDNILKALEGIFGSGLKQRFPLVVLCDAEGNIFRFSSGYRIGTGEQLLKAISAMQPVEVK